MWIPTAITNFKRSRWTLRDDGSVLAKGESVRCTTRNFSLSPFWNTSKRFPLRTGSEVERGAGTKSEQSRNIISGSDRKIIAASAGLGNSDWNFSLYLYDSQQRHGRRASSIRQRYPRFVPSFLLFFFSFFFCFFPFFSPIEFRSKYRYVEIVRYPTFCVSFVIR